MIMFASVSFIFAITVIPTYKFIVNKQSEILKLLATIQPHKIAEMLQHLSLCSHLIFAEQAQNNRTIPTKIQLGSAFIEVSDITKKKNISSTIPLRVSYIRLSAFIFVFFIII